MLVVNVPTSAIQQLEGSSQHFITENLSSICHVVEPKEQWSAQIEIVFTSMGFVEWNTAVVACYVLYLTNS